MRASTGEKIWVAVLVERGFVSEIEAYRDEALARRREKLWRRGMNPDYDETGLCDVIINESRMKRPSRRSRNGVRDTSSRASRVYSKRSRT